MDVFVLLIGRTGYALHFMNRSIEINLNHLKGMEFDVALSRISNNYYRSLSTTRAQLLYNGNGATYTHSHHGTYCCNIRSYN